MGSWEKTLTNSLSVQALLVPNRPAHSYKCKILDMFFFQSKLPIHKRSICELGSWAKLKLKIIKWVKNFFWQKYLFSKINYSPVAVLCATGWALSYGSNFPINILPESPFSTLLLLFLSTKNHMYISSRIMGRRQSWIYLQVPFENISVLV